MSHARLLTSEIYDYGINVQSDDEYLRSKHPGLKEAYKEYIEAKHKYDMLLKLVKVTDKF